MRPSCITILLFCLCFVAACERSQINGPPTLRLGRDECAECGMAIHEEKSAAALLIEREGRREHLLFDDIGCLLDLTRNQESELTIVDRFVHDQATGAWVRADVASFLATDGSSLLTPMASGLAAYSDNQGAQDGQRKYGGQIMDYASVQSWRRARIEERRNATGR